MSEEIESSGDSSSPENPAPKNQLKVRDDHTPVSFQSAKDPGKFVLCDGHEASWATKDQEFGLQELRNRIEPWLTALFQSEHLSLVAGSGLTHATHYLAASRPAAGMSGTVSESQFRKQILNAAHSSAQASGRQEGNLEDQIRSINELITGLLILGRTEEADELRQELSVSLKEFAEKILGSEAGIATAPDDQREKAFTALVSFLMSFASRTGTRDRLHIFTTNYDRVIEAGAEIAGLHLLDRFVGTLMPIFRSSRLDVDMHYNPPGIRGEPRYLEGVARFTKLHGSVDWLQTEMDVRRTGLPFGANEVAPYLVAPGIAEADPYRLMIYPNAAKDRETSEYPYVELFRDFASALCRPNSTVVTYGYGFGDEHINRVLRDMLTIPSTHLVVISRDDPLGRIFRLAERRPSQVTLLLGPQLADLATLTGYFLPKPAIDRATLRMSELLRHRYGSSSTSERKVEKSEDLDSSAPEVR